MTAIKPIDSVNAKPNIARPNNSPFNDGFLAAAVK